MSQSQGTIVSRPRPEFLQKWKLKNKAPFLVDDEENRVSISSPSSSVIYTNLLIIQEHTNQCFGCGAKPKTRSRRHEGNPLISPFRTEIKCDNCGYNATANTVNEFTRQSTLTWGQALLKGQLEREKWTPKWLENEYYENVMTEDELEDSDAEEGEDEENVWGET